MKKLTVTMLIVALTLAPMAACADSLPWVNQGFMAVTDQLVKATAENKRLQDQADQLYAEQERLEAAVAHKNSGLIFSALTVGLLILQMQSMGDGGGDGGHGHHKR